ncbi:MAG: exostosin family protein [Verrucomicrobiota bacterium]
MKRRLYSEKEWLPVGVPHVFLLDAFWGCDRYDPENNYRQVTASYFRDASSIFEMVATLAESDAALLPMDWHDTISKPQLAALAQRIFTTARLGGKPVIVFLICDAPIKVNWPPHALVIRIAVHRSWRQPNEHIIPQWSKDYIQDEQGGVLVTREKALCPVVGFCGYAPPLGMRWSRQKLKETLRLFAYYAGLAKWAPTRTAHAARVRALLELRKSPLVECNFLIREQSAFANSMGAFLPGGSVEAARVRRREFVNNLVASDYVLCSRGWANCNIRFYEALSAGRIPVLVDTDCVLPYEGLIDWEKYCVIVKESELADIGRQVSAFHSGLSSAEFVARQKACHQLYHEWLGPQGFFSHVHLLLKPFKENGFIFGTE